MIVNDAAQSNTLIEEAVEISSHPKSTEEILGSLKTLLQGDELEHRETFEFLKQALDEDRPSTRHLFSSK